MAKNGTIINGATNNTYQISSTILSQNNDKYYCVVTDSKNNIVESADSILYVNQQLLCNPPVGDLWKVGYGCFEQSDDSINIWYVGTGWTKARSTVWKNLGNYSLNFTRIPDTFGSIYVYLSNTATPYCALTQNLTKNSNYRLVFTAKTNINQMRCRIISGNSGNPTLSGPQLIGPTQSTLTFDFTCSNEGYDYIYLEMNSNTLTVGNFWIDDISLIKL